MALFAVYQRDTAEKCNESRTPLNYLKSSLLASEYQRKEKKLWFVYVWCDAVVPRGSGALWAVYQRQTLQRQSPNYLIFVYYPKQWRYYQLSHWYHKSLAPCKNEYREKKYPPKNNSAKLFKRGTFSSLWVLIKKMKMLWYFYVGCDVRMFVWWLKCYGYVNLSFYKHDIAPFFYSLGDTIVSYL